jgi:drug/metabolite transporter (DMT)-like permease
MVSGVIWLILLVLVGGLEQHISSSLLLTCLGFAIGEVCLYLSLYKAFEAADVTVAAGLVSIYPILSTAYTIIFLHEKLSAVKLLAVLMMVVGAIIVSLDWKKLRAEGLSKNSFVKGLGWVLVCLILHSIYFPALGAFTAHGNWETRLLGIKIFATLILFVLFFVVKRNKFAVSKDRIFYTGLLGFLEITGWVGLSYASNNSTGIIAIIVALGSTAPIVTAIFARIFLRERLQILQYCGIVLTIVCTVLLSVV